MPFCWFCHEAAHVSFVLIFVTLGDSVTLSMENINLHMPSLQFGGNYDLKTNMEKPEYFRMELCVFFPSSVKTNNDSDNNNRSTALELSVVSNWGFKMGMQPSA